MLRRAFLFVLFLPLFYITTAFIGGVVTAPASKTITLPPKLIQIGLISGPIHYDFLLPLTDDTRSAFVFLNTTGLPITAPSAKWLIVGWGAREFYTTVGTYRDVTARAVWRGLAGDNSVMRIDVAGPISPQVELLKIWVSKDEYARLLHAIRASFAMGPSNSPFRLPEAGLSGTDIFYAANGRFNLFETCNVWIGQMLREAGLKFGMWTPTPYAVSLSHWLYQTR